MKTSISTLAILCSALMLMAPLTHASIFDTVIGSKPKKTIGANRPRVPLESNGMQTVNAGMVTTFTSKFFDDYNNDIMDAFISKI